MSHFTALLDANVLHSYPLTSLLLELAEARLYRPVWSADIHAEWMRSVQAARPDIAPVLLERRRAAMDAALPDARIDGYQRLVPALSLPDPDDRHVLAAAIRAKAEVIVTFNGKDFPASELATFGIHAQHPDAFVCHLIDLNPATVFARVQAMLAGWRQPPVTSTQYLEFLERCGLQETAMALRGLLSPR